MLPLILGLGILVVCAVLLAVWVLRYRRSRRSKQIVNRALGEYLASESEVAVDQTDASGDRPKGVRIRGCAQEPGTAAEFIFEGGCTEVSEVALQMNVPMAIPLKSVISFRIEALRRQGWGVVSETQPRGSRHIVTVEIDREDLH